MLAVLPAVLMLTATPQGPGRFTQKADDLKSVIRKLAVYTLPEKDDFETTDQWLARLPTYDTSKQFVLIESESSTIYDADDSTFTLWGPWMRPCEGGVQDLGWVRRTVGADSKVVRTYMASNSFGRKVKVTHKHIDRYSLDSLNLLLSTLTPMVDEKYGAELVDFNPNKPYTSDDGDEYRYLAAVFKVEPSQAKRLHKKLSCAIVVTFKGYLEAIADFDHYEATINDPVELTVKHHKAEARIVRMVFFDRSTKEIFMDVAVQPKW